MKAVVPFSASLPLAALDRLLAGPDMAALMDAFVGADKGRSLAVASLSPAGPLWGRNLDVVRPGASVLKLPLVAALLHAGAVGSVDLARAVRVGDLGTSKWSNVIDGLSPDTALSLRDLAALCVMTSDNASADYLCRLLGFDAVNGWLDAIGCSQETRLRSGYGDDAIEMRGRLNTITARDGVTCLQAIAATDELLQLRHFMRNNIRNQRIPRFLDDDVTVCHKTGSLNGVVNDVGIVEHPAASFAVVFLCQDQPDTYATEGEVARTAQAMCELLRRAVGNA